MTRSLLHKSVLIFVLLCHAFVTWAQPQGEITITSDVKDAFLKTPLVEAMVSICRPDSSVLVDSCYRTIYYQRNGKPLSAVYSAKVKTGESELLLHARLKGYEDVWQRISIGTQAKVEVPTLEMRKMRETNLNEVEVKATRIKMFYRGDTIVYDATAFKLPQGSMLNDLIRQMPGVKMNEAGEIFVNGRKVDELLLGSRSFMRGNKKVLMENLPYFTVKHVKVYNKQTDKSMALGYDVEPKKLVMDVNLKREYQHGYIANVEGAAGTNERWLGRAFLLSFTDRYRFTMLGNLNNVNETRHIGQSNNWTPATMPKNLVTTRSAAGEMDYQNKKGTVKNNLTASYTSTTDVSESRSRYEQFLQGETPVSLTTSFNSTGNHQWNAHDELSLNKPLYLNIASDFTYTKSHNRLNAAFDQFSDTLTASQRTHSFGEGETWSGNIEATGAFNIGKKQKYLGFYIKAEHTEDDSKSAQSYNTTQYAGRQQTKLHNLNDISNRTSLGYASLNYNTKLFSGVDMQLNETLYLTQTKVHDYLYHPDTLTLSSQVDALRAVTDFNNSYDSKTKAIGNIIGLTLSGKAEYKIAPDNPFAISYQPWTVGISLPVRHESLNYQRGRLDTLATQNTFFVNANASFRHVSKDGKHDFRAKANHQRTGASLSDCITYRDDSQPLVVKLGNPDLKSIITSNFAVDFYNKGANQQQWHAGASADIYHRQTAQSVTYNAATGVYTYQPVNVTGAYRLNARFDITRAIDKKRYWTWQANADAFLNHDVDYAMLSGMTASDKNVVNTLTLHDGAYLQYNRGSLNVRATGDIRWRHSEGKMYDFETLNATDFQYGFSARYTIPTLNMTVSADGTMYSRRGYGSRNLNTDDFILNASVSQPFFKGKLIARIEAFDLLQQITSTQYEVNAQGRTEMWNRSLPHYVMAHIVYHFSKNPKKK